MECSRSLSLLSQTRLQVAHSLCQVAGVVMGEWGERDRVRNDDYILMISLSPSLESEHVLVECCDAR